MSMLGDSATMITNGPSALTAANAASGTFAAATSPYLPGGAPADYVGLLDLLRTKEKEVKLLLQELKAITDSGDTNLTLINNGLTALG